MASTHPNQPVMHCTVKEVIQVNTLAGRLITQGVYFNTSVFLTPPVTLLVFEAANDKLTALIAQAKGNSTAKKDRDAQALLVFNYLEELLLYVKQLAKGDITIIDKSGFDANAQPVPTVVPDMPVIKKVIEGKEVGTYKIILVKRKAKVLLAKKAGKTKGNRHLVQSTLTPTVDSSWTDVLRNAASTKLILTDLPLLTKTYLRVIAANSAGESQPSAPFPFTPQ